MFIKQVQDGHSLLQHGVEEVEVELQHVFVLEDMLLVEGVVQVGLQAMEAMEIMDFLMDVVYLILTRMVLVAEVILVM